MQAGLDIQRSPTLSDKFRDRLGELSLAVLGAGRLELRLTLRAKRTGVEPDILRGIAFLAGDEA